MVYKLKLFLFIVLCGSLQGQTPDVAKNKLADNLQTLFKSYYSSSFLWQNIAHYLNRSKVALPGFSNVFSEFSKVDQQQANRVLEITAQRGFKFTDYALRTSSLPTQAINKYEKSLKTPVPCSPTKFKSSSDQTAMFKFMMNKPTTISIVPRAYQMLQFTQIIEHCNNNINLKHWENDPHLKWTILREFTSEREYRNKYIADLLQKLKDGDTVVEFFLDKNLKSTAMKY